MTPAESARGPRLAAGSPREEQSAGQRDERILGDAGTPRDVLLVGDREAARLVGCSRAHWRRLAASARVPASIGLGRCRRWIVADLRRWTEIGCPSRAVFEARMEHERGGAR
jgi:predicted DNA-binding transcriptional regulator AlpA